MRLYFGISDWNDVPMLDEYKVDFLLSYHYFKSKKKRQLIRDYFKKRGSDHVMIDSGAFSAENSGVAIDIKEYMDYLRDIKPALYAGLDVIGNAESTWSNQAIMEDKGFEPFPTFHAGEPFEYLERAIEKYDFFALGGMVGAHRDVLETWLDKCWSVIWSSNKRPKVHGFGLTAVYLMSKYPWYSVDSVSYKSVVMYGNLRSWGTDFKKIKTIHMNQYIAENYPEHADDVRKVRDIVTRHQLEQFIGIRDYITELHKTQDFSYLKKHLFG